MSTLTPQGAVTEAIAGLVESGTSRLGAAGGIKARMLDVWRGDRQGGSRLTNKHLADAESAMSLELDFRKPYSTSQALDPRITFSRAFVSGTNHTGTYFDASGVLCEAKVNLVVYSQTTSDASWGIAAGCAKTSTNNSFIDGSSGALLLTSDGSSGAHSAYFGNASATLAAYTCSVFVKPNTVTRIQLSFGSTGFGTSQYGNFSLVGSGSVLAEYSAGAAKITSVGNGWYRISLTATATSTTAGALGVVTFINSDTATRNPSYVGTATDSVYLCGGQVETGSTASTYIPTTTAASAAPRFDYDPVTLTPKGLLIEESRVNNELNTTALTKGVAGDTVTTTNAGAPDGTATAVLHTSDGTSGVHSLLQGSGTPTLGNTYTLSIFLKAGTGSLVQLAPGSAHGGATIYCNYNLSTGAMTAGGGIVANSNFCTLIGNGWYRCGFSYVASATAAGAFCATWPLVSMSDTRAPTNSVSTSYYRWGGQFESTATMGSAAFATSYIPTATTSLTRAADSAGMTNTNFSSWWNATEGTFVATADMVGSSGNLPCVLSADDATINERIQLRGNVTGASYNFNVVDGGSAQVGLNPGTYVAASTARIAGSFAINNFGVCVNGGTVSLDTSGTIPTPTQLNIGNGANSAYLNGHISRLVYFNKRLPDSTLIALTK